MKQHTITCNNCKGSSRVMIDEQNRKVMFKDHLPIISGRYRIDQNWGWECQCGNDSRMAPEEKKDAEVLVSGLPKQSIKQMVANLEPKPNTRFSIS